MITTPRLSWTRKRALTATVESDDLARVSGLFSMNGCPLRSADSSRVQVAAADFVPDTSNFALVFTVDFDGAHDADANTHVFADWTADADNWLRVHFDGADDKVYLSVRSGGTTAFAATSALTWTAGQRVLVVAYGNKAGNVLGVAVSVDGGAIASFATGTYSVAAPDLSGVTTMDLGRLAAGGSTYLEGVFSYVASFQHVPVAAEADYLVDLARMPALGELPVDTASLEPCALWQAHRREYETGLVLDLNTTLDDPEGIHVLPPLGGLAEVPTVMRATQTPNRDGSVVSEVLFDDRFINALLELSGTDWAALNAQRQVLARATNPRNMGAREALGVLTYCPYEGSQAYSIEAVRSALVMSQPFLDIIERPTLSLRCPSPALRTEPVTVTTVLANVGGMDIESDIPTDISAADSTVVTNGQDGDVPSAPIIRIYGPVENPYVEHSEQAKRFALAYDVPDGEVVTINMAARTATLSDGTSVMGYRSATSQMWELLPGDNTVVTGFLDATATPVTFEIEYHQLVAGV